MIIFLLIIFQNWLLYSSRGYFSGLYYENLVGLLEENSWKCVCEGGRGAKTGPQEFVILKESTHSPQHFTNHGLHFPALDSLQCCLLLVNCDSLFAPLSSFQSITISLFCDINSLTELRRVTDFVFFMLWGQEWWIPSSWHVWAEIQSPVNGLYIWYFISCV